MFEDFPSIFTVSRVVIFLLFWWWLLLLIPTFSFHVLVIFLLFGGGCRHWFLLSIIVVGELNMISRFLHLLGCFMNQDMVYLHICYKITWKEWVFCCCWVDCSINVSWILLVDGLFSSLYPCWFSNCFISFWVGDTDISSFMIMDLFILLSVLSMSVSYQVFSTQIIFILF